MELEWLEGLEAEKGAEKRGGNRMVEVETTRDQEGSRARAEEKACSTCTRSNPTGFKLAALQPPASLASRASLFKIFQTIE